MWELDHRGGAPKNWYFQVVVLEKTLGEVPWTAMRSNQSILKKINLEYSLEGLFLKLKSQYFGTWCKEPTHWKRPNSLEKTLMLGKTEGRWRRQQQRMRLLDGITNSMDMNLSKLQETEEDRESWSAAAPGVTKNQTQSSLYKPFYKV